MVVLSRIPGASALLQGQHAVSIWCPEMTCRGGRLSPLPAEQTGNADSFRNRMHSIFRSGHDQTSGDREGGLREGGIRRVMTWPLKEMSL